MVSCEVCTIKWGGLIKGIKEPSHRNHQWLLYLTSVHSKFKVFSSGNKFVINFDCENIKILEILMHPKSLRLVSDKFAIVRSWNALP
jgi:hypothetical protein